MNQEWYCTSTVIAQVMIVFITSIYDKLNSLIWYFIKVAVTRMLANALDKVVTFAGEFLFVGKLTTLTKLEATPGDRIGLRMSGQLEELFTMNEQQAKVFLISSLLR